MPFLMQGRQSLVIDLGDEFIHQRRSASFLIGDAKKS